MSPSFFGYLVAIMASVLIFQTACQPIDTSSVSGLASAHLFKRSEQLVSTLAKPSSSKEGGLTQLFKAAAQPGSSFQAQKPQTYRKMDFGESKYLHGATQSHSTVKSQQVEGGIFEMDL